MGCDNKEFCIRGGDVSNLQV